MTITLVSRRVAATPARPAAEAWKVITDLVTMQGPAREELGRCAGFAMSLIAGEAMRESPIVLHGVGPRLRIYCLYDQEAVLGEGQTEDVLSWCATCGNWAMSLPCPSEDLSWVAAALARISSRVTARDLAEATPGEGGNRSSADRAELGAIDLGAFLRP